MSMQACYPPEQNSQKCSIPIAISEFEQCLLYQQGCIRDEKTELDRVEEKSKEH